MAYRKKRKHIAKKKMNNQKTGKSNLGSLMGLLLITILIFGGVAYWRLGGGAKEATTPEVPTVTPTATPTPIRLPAKPVKYNVTQSKHEGPTFVSVTFDPLDAQKDQDLTITTKITNSSPITNVNGSLATDNGRIDLTFKRISGDDKNGEWKTTIRLNDTVWYTYTLTLTATGSNGTSTIKTSPR